MNFDDLLDYLEIDTPDDFAYFEHFAALIECDEEIPYELFFKVLAGVDSETLVDLTDNYFDEVLQGMPDDGIEIYTLFTTIKQSLLGLAKAAQTREDKVLYVDELYKFRLWYIFDSVVHCRRLSDNTSKNVPLSEALSLSRLEKLNEEQYSYDFTDCMDYEIDEYSLSINASIADDYDDIDDEDDDLYDEGLIDRDYPVIDGDE